MRTTKKTDGGTVYKQLLINAKLKTGKRGKKNSWLGEFHQGGEGAHWTVVPYNNNNNNNNNNEEEEEVVVVEKETLGSYLHAAYDQLISEKKIPTIKH